MRIVNDRARLSHLFGHGPSPFSETQQWAIIAFSGTKRTPTRLFGLSEPIDDPVRPAAAGGVEDQPRMVIPRVAQQIRLDVEADARPFEIRSEDLRVGKESVSTCRYRWSRLYKTTNSHN